MDIETPEWEFKVRSSGITIWGGKFNAVPLLLSYFPKPNSRLKFVDVFTGSGVVSLNYWPRSCVMNDKNKYLFAFMYVLNGVKFGELMHKFSQSREMPYYIERFELYCRFMIELCGVARGPEWFEEFRKRDDLVSRAISFLILNRNNYSGWVRIDTSSTDFTFKCPTRVPLFAFEELVRFFKFRDVRVWNFDFREVLERVENWKETKGQEVFIYLDPPYIEAGEGLYEFDFTEDDLIDMRDLLSNTEHHWIMSNEDSPLVRKLFKNCYFQKVRWCYTGTKSGRTTKEKGTHELLVSNKPLVKRERELDSMQNLEEWLK